MSDSDPIERIFRDDFAIFIISNRRPNRPLTRDSLRRKGFTGRIVCVVDDEDPTIEEYRKTYDEVVVFDKQAASAITDHGDNFQDLRSPIFARNAAWDIAEDLGLTYFCVMDDDYTEFEFRYTDTLDYYAHVVMGNIDAIFIALLRYYIRSGAWSLALAQGGDFLGGSEGEKAGSPRVLRKAMNSFFCSTERRYDFMGCLNDDVNTYVVHGGKGGLFLSVTNASLTQRPTQQNPGGLTEIYLDRGTYVKSFYTVMMAPSCVKIALMKSRHMRLHHRISTWANAVPKIVSEDLRKV